MFIYPRCHSHICESVSHSPIDVVSLWFSRTKKGMWVTIGTDQQLSTRTRYALLFLSLQHLILLSLTTVNITPFPLSKISLTMRSCPVFLACQLSPAAKCNHSISYLDQPGNHVHIPTLPFTYMWIC